MKKVQLKKLQWLKATIANINTMSTAQIKGGTEPVSPPAGFSAHASQCENNMCF